MNRETGSDQRRTGLPIEEPVDFRLTESAGIGYLVAERTETVAARRQRFQSPTIGYLIAERAETVAALRQQFRARGFDVQRYSDDAVSKALLADSGKALSPAKRITLAFKRLVERSA